jgi:hypothetical protein
MTRIAADRGGCHLLADAIEEGRGLSSMRRVPADISYRLPPI